MPQVIMTISIVILIILSGLFSASETAYSTASKIRLANMVESGDKKAAKVLKIVENYDKMLFPVLIGNNIVNIAASTIATVLFISVLGDIGATVSTIVLTITVLIFGEITPKLVAKQNPEKFAKFVYGFLRLFTVLLYPITIIFVGWKWLISKIFKFKQTATFTEEELITIVETAENEGEIEKHESELIRSAIEFEDLDVRDIMVPRVNVEAISVDMDMEEIFKVFVQSGYSRLPVYREDIDTIVGILHEKDFSALLHDGGKDITPIIQKGVYLSPSIKISTALSTLQKAKIHMAIVVDEFGGTEGIITLEDILEELVGEIYDEHDDEEEWIKKLDDRTFVVQADENYEEVLEELEVKIALEETEATTVGGLVTEQLGVMPVAGDKLELSGVTFEVTKANEKQVQEVKITLPEQSEEE